MPLAATWHPSPAISRAPARPLSSAAGRSSRRAWWSTPPTSSRAGRRPAAVALPGRLAVRAPRAGQRDRHPRPGRRGADGAARLVHDRRRRPRLGGRRHLLGGELLRQRGRAVPLGRRRALPRLLPAASTSAWCCWCVPACAGSMPASGSTGSRPRWSSRRSGSPSSCRRSSPGARAARCRPSPPTSPIPSGDLVVLGLVIALAALMGWRPGRAVGLLAAGCVTFALADSVYLFKIAAGTYVEGGFLDVFWPLGLIFMGLAAWQPAARVRAGRLEGWSVMILPAAVAFGAIALLVYDHYARTAVSAVWLASAALVVCIARAGLTFRENIAQAVTDTLTGLPNRRLFQDRADQAINRARRQGERAAVMIIDLDRFKEVNDTLGHHCGDLLLEEMARRLRRSAARERHRRPARRRRVRRAPPQRRRRGGGGAGGDGARQGHLRVDRRRGRFPRHRGEHRHRALPGPRRGRQRAAPAGGRRDVHGQGGAPALRRLRVRARRVQPRAARARGRAAAGDRAGRARAPLPAQGAARERRAAWASRRWCAGSTPSAGCCPRRVHPARRAHGADRAAHPARARSCAGASARRWRDDGRALSVAVNISARNLLDGRFAGAVAASLAAPGRLRGRGWSSR